MFLGETRPSPCGSPTLPPSLSASLASPRPVVEKKLGVKRQKKMSSALLNLTRSVQELTEENQSLKEDLDRMLSNSPTISKIKGTRLPAGHAQREGGATRATSTGKGREGARSKVDT